MHAKYLSRVLIALFMAACSAPPPQRTEDTPPAEAPQVWRLTQEAAGQIRSQSCPDRTASKDLMQIPLSVMPVTPGTPEQLAASLPPRARLSLAWELASDNPDFGGISGLARLPDEDGGGLLAVTDAGSFIWIRLADEAPAMAFMSRMREPEGRPYPRKSEGDAEGLVYSDGIALVSFERRFRIEGFDLRSCAPNASGVLLATLPDRYEGQGIDENQGPEALFLSPGGELGFGYEGMLGISPIGRVLQDGSAEWTGFTAPTPPGFGLVGREEIVMPGGKAGLVEMFRAWDPVQGNRIQLRWGRDDTQLISLGAPLLTDNFEGLTAETMPEGGLRIWIISDDNFSDRQQTLLYAFDIIP